MNTNSFFDLVPTFMSGVKALHDELIGVAFVITVAGLLIHACAALVRKDLAQMFPTLVRLTVISMLIGYLASWGNMLSATVQALISEMGVSGTGSNIFQDYQAAVARKMGTAAATNNFSHGSSSQGFAPTEGDTSGGFSLQGGPTTGVTLTHYAYPGDSTGDPNSSKGIGAFEWDSAPGSLMPGYSAAVSDSVAKQYGLQAGQSFSITTSGGQTYNLVYADVVPATYNGQPIGPRIDIYDPNGQLPGGNDFSQSITSLNGGPVVQGQAGPGSMLPNPGGSIGDQLLWAITLALSWIASAIMWLMQIAQQLLFLIEVGISPVFIALLMIPALSYLARHFFLTLVSICLWPLGWAVCDLVSKFLIDLAVNPTGNLGLFGASVGALVSGPLAGMAYLLVVAVWVIGSTLAAPLFINHLLAGRGSGATAAVFGATLGAAASRGAATWWRGIGGGAGAVGLVNAVTGGNAAPVSQQSGSLMSSSQNFARRPINPVQRKES